MDDGKCLLTGLPAHQRTIISKIIIVHLIMLVLDSYCVGDTIVFIGSVSPKSSYALILCASKLM